MANATRLAVMILGVATAQAFAGGPGPLASHGIEYRIEHEQDKSDGPLKAWVVAFDPSTETVFWRVKLYEGTSRGAWLKPAKNPRVVSLTNAGKGLVALTDDGASFYVDLTARTAQLVSDRRAAGHECEVHHALMTTIVVPIHYGLMRSPLMNAEERKKYPNADRAIGGGCCVMDERAALVWECPACREGRATP